ncbi:MAG TPA: DUF938 domain-containing protein [Allosphingosinicella sp.]|jgi:hypothetical protein
MKRHAPASERNREPIARALRQILPERGLLLEIAAGTGEHAAYLAPLFAGLRWQPSDPDPVSLTSIEAWQADSEADNLLPPLFLDAASSTWPLDSADAILCIAAGAPLVLYGPYLRAGVETAPSNEAFDQSLKARNPEWGLRHLEAVRTEAEGQGLLFDGLHQMPANNLMLMFRKA